MIAITGATGHLGRLVITALLKKVPPSGIIAVVRNVEKAKDLTALGVQVRVADYNQPQAWDDSLKGCDKVLLISASEVGKRVKQHRSVIDAAKRTGVKLLAYTSILRADTSPLGVLGAEHKETEGLIRASGVPFTLLRHSWYIENYTAGIANALAQGAIYGCAGEGRISAATRADYAEAAVVVLTTENQAGVYELAGDTAFTMTELATELSRQSNKKVGYVNLSEAEYKNVLVKAGLPEPIAAMVADSDTGISKGGLFDDGRQLSKLINRPTTLLATAIAGAMK